MARVFMAAPSKAPKKGEVKPRAMRPIKPKVRLDGTPAPDCIPCQKKKKRDVTV